MSEIHDSGSGRDVSLAGFRNLLWTSDKRPTNEQIEDYYFQDDDDIPRKFRSPEEEFWQEMFLYHDPPDILDVDHHGCVKCGEIIAYDAIPRPHRYTNTKFMDLACKCGGVLYPTDSVAWKEIQTTRLEQKL